MSISDEWGSSSSSAFLSTLVDVDDDEERMFAKIARSTNEAHSAELGARVSKLVRRSKTDRVIVFHRLVTKTTLRRHKNWFIFSITSGGRGRRWSVCVCECLNAERDRFWRSLWAGVETTIRCRVTLPLWRSVCVTDPASEHFHEWISTFPSDSFEILCGMFPDSNSHVIAFTWYGFPSIAFV